MTRLILKPRGISTSVSLRVDAEPRFIDSDVDAGRKVGGIAPVAATETPSRVRRAWRWFTLGPEVDVARANLTYIEEMMLNLP